MKKIEINLMRLEHPAQASRTLRNGNRRGDPTRAPRCCAKTRQGTPCNGPAMRGKKRCRMHGGNAGAPKGNANALKHGLYTTSAIQERNEFREIIQEYKDLLNL